MVLLLCEMVIKDIGIMKSWLLSPVINLPCACSFKGLVFSFM